MPVVNTNINSIVAQNATNKSDRAMTKTMEKLSTGYRINKAGDDAAGLAVSTKLTAQIRGTNQAARNVSDAIALVQTADGAAKEISAIMQRSEQPTAAAFLNLTLETKTQLKARYQGVPIFSSCEEMLADEETMAKTDGVIICTAHACHADMGAKFLAAGKHVLMEK